MSQLGPASLGGPTGGGGVRVRRRVNLSRACFTAFDRARTPESFSLGFRIGVRQLVWVIGLGLGLGCRVRVTVTVWVRVG